MMPLPVRQAGLRAESDLPAGDLTEAPSEKTQSGEQRFAIQAPLLSQLSCFGEEMQWHRHLLRDVHPVVG